MTSLPDSPFEIDPEKHKELFSRAYVHAIASAGGYTVEFHNANDDDSCEVMIKARGGPGPKKSPRLEAQLKSTASPTFNASGTHLLYPLKQKNYRDLIADCSVDRILLLVVVPPDVSDWLAHSPECLHLHRCCYWLSLRDFPSTENKTKTNIRIPRIQLFTPAVLDAMMVKIASRMPL